MKTVYKIHILQYYITKKHCQFSKFHRTEIDYFIYKFHKIFVLPFLKEGIGYVKTYLQVNNCVTFKAMKTVLL